MDQGRRMETSMIKIAHKNPRNKSNNNKNHIKETFTVVGDDDLKKR